jgi:anti-sigma factor RsiW
MSAPPADGDRAADPSWCVRFRSWEVTDYLDRALLPDERDRVEFHLVTCAACAEVLHTHRHLIPMLRVLRSH